MIVHLDGDAFFASVEQAATARLRGKAVAVGGLRRGIIASASYEARRCGVYTPMPTSRALKVCPHLILVPGDFEKYEHFSRMMFSYFYDFTPEVEITGIDEGYADMGGNHRVSAERAAEKIRRGIVQSLKITVSEGVAANKLVAQIASKSCKPYGLTHVAAGQEARFLDPLDVGWLPGVGPKAVVAFRQAGLRLIGDVAQAPHSCLRLLVGRGAETLSEHARGIDLRPVVATREAAKSYGQQETFDEDTVDAVYVRRILRLMTDRQMERMRNDDVCARTVSLHLRYTDMVEVSRSESLLEPTRLADDFYGVVEHLLLRAWDRRVRLRMVRVAFSNLYRGYPVVDLFHETEGRNKKDRLQTLVAEVQARYGTSSLMRGHQFLLNNKDGESATD